MLQDAKRINERKFHKNKNKSNIKQENDAIFNQKP